MPDLPSVALKVLGHPHRLAIVRRPMEHDLGCASGSSDGCGTEDDCCDFAALAHEMEVGKSTASHPLRELVHAGLVDRHREGRRVYCRLNRALFDDLHALLRADRPR